MHCDWDYVGNALHRVSGDLRTRLQELECAAGYPEQLPAHICWLMDLEEDGVLARCMKLDFECSYQERDAACQELADYIRKAPALALSQVEAEILAGKLETALIEERRASEPSCSL